MYQHTHFYRLIKTHCWHWVVFPRETPPVPAVTVLVSYQQGLLPNWNLISQNWYLSILQHLVLLLLTADIQQRTNSLASCLQPMADVVLHRLDQLGLMSAKPDILFQAYWLGSAISFKLIWTEFMRKWLEPLKLLFFKLSLARSSKVAEKQVHPDTPWR